MALPSVLKNYNVFNEGVSHIGQVEEVKLPDLKRKMEKFRGGGMDGEVSIDLGQEPLELEATYGGIMEEILKQYGCVGVAGKMIRFAGAYQQDDTCAVKAVEVIVRGRHEEISLGSAKGGDKNKFVVKSALSYYKLSIDSKEVIEIDLLNFIFKVDGKDQLEAQRKAIGMSA